MLISVSLVGIITFAFSMLNKIQSAFLEKIIVISMLFSLPFFTSLIDLGAGINTVWIIPNQVIKSVKLLNLNCVYSNSPYETAWYLDLPTIYKPMDNMQMLSSGPNECNRFFYIDKNDLKLEEFLEKNGKLVLIKDDYMLYELLN